MFSAGLFLLRLVLSAVLVAHGGHVLGIVRDTGAGPGGLTLAAARYASLGLTPAFALALGDGLLRLVGGGLVGAGLFTRWIAIPLIGLEALQIMKDSARWGFFLNWTSDPTRGHGIEFSLLLMGALACLIFTGAGTWSIDGLRQRSASSRAAGRARLRDRS